MFGKIFATTFTGSMFGAGAEVFAVWAYTLANTGPDSHVELNPKLLAVSIGAPEDRIRSAVEYLCSPDANSRTKEQEGRRLVKKGEFLYEVVNHAKYRSIRDEADRREYFREAKRRSRARQTLSNDASKTVKDSQGKSTMSTHEEAEADSRERALLSLSKPIKTTKPIKLTKSQKAIADRFEAALCSQWVNDAGKWIGRIKANTSTCERIVSELESAAKESRINTTPAQYAEDTWQRFTGA